jgi:hypothetical protein
MAALLERHVFSDGELNPDATIRKFRTVARKGACRLKSLGAHRKVQATTKNIKGAS